MSGEYEYKIAPASPFQEKYLNDNSRWLIVGGAMGCVDMDTEYLGEYGWRKISEYSGEQIYQYSLEDDDVELITPEHRVEMGTLLYHFESEYIDKVVSLDHRMVWWDKNGPHVNEAKHVVDKYNANEDVVGWLKGFDGCVIKDIPFAGYTIKEYIPKDRKQYCFVTETGWWVARRNGKPFITGNSSKSYIGLMRHLRYIHDPKYVGVIVRKNMKAIKAAGGLWDEAVNLFKRVDPTLRTTLEPRRIHFTNGATIEFMHYENDRARDNFQGLNLDTAFYDEVTHASEEHVWWINSRIRNASSNIKHKSFWMSCNPDPDAWLMKYVEWYLYPEGHPKEGLPNPERNGVGRYMFRKDGKIYFSDTAEDLVKKYGVKGLPLGAKGQIEPISITVLLGTVYDNPVLLEKSPEYLASLKAMPEIEMRRNLLGDWFARPQNSGFFDRAWCEEVVGDIDPHEIVATVRAYDFAGTLPSDVNPSPDYTACAKISKLKDGRYMVRDIKRTRIRFGDWKEFILSNAIEDSNEYPPVEIVLPIDPNPAAKSATLMLAREVGSEGLIVKTHQSTNKKLDAFRPFAAMAQNEGVIFLKDCTYDLDNNTYGNEIAYKELERFDGGRSHATKKDDRLLTCRL